MLCDTNEISEMVALKEMTLCDGSPQRKRNIHHTSQCLPHTPYLVYCLWIINGILSWT